MESINLFDAKNILERPQKIIFAECSLEYLEKHYNDTRQILDYSGIIFRNKELANQFNKLPEIKEDELVHMDNAAVIMFRDLGNGNNSLHIRSSQIREINGNILVDHVTNYRRWMSLRILRALGYYDYKDFTGNEIIFDRFSGNGSIQISKSRIDITDNRLQLGYIDVMRSLDIGLYGNGGLVEVGEYTTFVGGSIHVTTNGKVSIGSYCMFSHDFLVSQPDQHSIFDLKTHKRLNTGKNVAIGNHVWIGRYAKLGGGSGIPDNCIVGEGTVTTRRFEEPACIIAGCPGRIIRRDVLWARDDQRNDLQTYEECKDKKALDFLSREQWENFNAWRE